MNANLFFRLTRSHDVPRIKALINRGVRPINHTTNQSRIQIRSMSSDTAIEPTQKTSTINDVPEEEFAIYNFNKVDLVPERPINSLGIEKRAEKVVKKGSFSVDLFNGKYDHDFLTYPSTLKDSSESKVLQDQATMVSQMWPQIWEDSLSMHKYNFHKLYRLSVTEMMSVFEAIGASTLLCFEAKIPELDETVDRRKAAAADVTHAVISLIIRNCLTYWPLDKYGSEQLQGLLHRKELVYRPPDPSDPVMPPIGFGWTEQGMGLGSLPPQEWETLGTYGDDPPDHVSIRGTKHRVLYDEAVEKYLVFYRDGVLSQRFQDNPPNQEANPNVDPFMGCVLIDKQDLQLSQLYSDSAGIKYVDIGVDMIVPPGRSLIKPDRLQAKGLNIKALGQVATCSVVLGLMKDSLRRTYKYLLNHRDGLLTCDIVQRMLTVVTSKIFALESMTYYIAGMYDGLEEGFDAHLEATILKIVTGEYASRIVQDLQRICGSDMFMTSQVQDLVNIFDSFLDGDIHNRLYLSTLGVNWYARSQNKHLNQLRLSPWYPGYTIKQTIRGMIERGNHLTIRADIRGNLHPSLKEAAENLEYILKRVKFAAEEICMKHGSDVTSAQSGLYMLSQISIDAFMLTTMCARASKSYCDGNRNSDLDVMLATSHSYELASRVKQYIIDITTIPLIMTEARADVISEMNLKRGGYYADSPLDPNA